MPATPKSEGASSRGFSSLDESPENLESTAVAAKLDEAEEEIGDALCKIEMDYLEDTLLPPLNWIAQALQDKVPEVVAAAKKQVDSFFSKLPCSAILHLLSIETMTIWIFYYSVYNTAQTVIVEAAKYMNKDETWPEMELVDDCLAEHAKRLLWMSGHLHPADCFDAATVELQQDAEDDNLPIMGMINLGCLFLCITLWLVVLGNFLWRTSCRLWVRYNSGLYLQNSFCTRRSWPYRAVCGLLCACGLLGICGLMGICVKVDIFGWFLSSQFTNVIVVLISARSFLAPTKPKFDYNELHRLNFKRSSFFQTNGGFAVALSDALIQSARGTKYRGPLLKLLARGEKDWKRALEICFIGKNKQDSGNKVLLKLWGVAVDNLPKAAEAVENHASTLESEP